MNSSFEKLVANAKTSISILERNNEKNAAIEISNLVRQANRTDVVVMVCGEFKRGKSSFINSLLETNVCVVDPDIATASISVIKYGLQTKVTRYFGVGDELNQETIDFEDIEKYTRGNSIEVQGTVQLEIELNNEKLKNGLIIIDSPGVGGMNPMHKHLTKSFIPQADIVLFMLHAEEPMSDSEVSFFKEEILGKAKRTAFIMNKKDANPNFFEKMDDAVKKITEKCNITEDSISIVAYSAYLKELYLKKNDKKLYDSSNAKAIDDLIDSLVAKYRSELIIDNYTLIYNSLEEVKNMWVEKHRELSNFDTSSLIELTKIQEKIETRINEITNPNSAFRREITEKITLNRANISSSMSSKQMEIKAKAEEMINSGKKPEEISEYIKQEIENYAEEIINQITTVKNEIAQKLDSCYYEDNGLFEVDGKITDEQKKKVQKYYGPVIIVVGLKSLLASFLGGPIAIAIAVWAGWKAFKDSGRESLKNSLNKTLSEIFIKLSQMVNSQLISIDLLVPSLIDEFSTNINNRLKETIEVIKNGQANIAEQQKELARIVKHEINPINDIQAEILRQRDEINTEF
jgi:hypothetical protein